MLEAEVNAEMVTNECARNAILLAMNVGAMTAERKDAVNTAKAVNTGINCREERYIGGKIHHGRDIQTSNIQKWQI